MIQQRQLVSTDLLQTPPFPSAHPIALCRPATGHKSALTDGDVDALLAAIARARVGGTYWGAQPELPSASYLLIRVRDSTIQEAHSAPGAQPQVHWTDAERTPAFRPGTTVVSGECDPWHLLARASKVVTDGNDPIALLAAIAGVPLQIVSPGSYDTLAADGVGRRALRAALRRTAIDNVAYRDPFTGEPIDIARAIELCAFWRGLIDGNRGIDAAFGFAAWKQATVRALLWPGPGDLRFSPRVATLPAGAAVAVWRSRLSRREEADLDRKQAKLIEVEDGFIRSAGLGADCVPPLSITVDAQGPYFDPSQPSGLEDLLQQGAFAPLVLERARALRELIVRLGISKYGRGRERLARRGANRHILVTGQVEDDRSVISGGGDVTTNLELLRRVRADRPEAYILYKPHPDVEAGHRIGAIADSDALGLANEVVRDAAITPLIEMVDEVHVNTSLAGFEALLRGKPVTTHGVPFYAGWGLTRDLGNIPKRRTARRTIDELVAAALLVYPRYLDPETGLPCPPEILIQRLASGATAPSGALVSLRRFQGRLNNSWKRLKTIRP